MINSKRPAGPKTFLMPFGDRSERQHFDATDDAARGEHFNQCRENVEGRTCGGAGFHLVLSKRSAIRICQSCDKTFVTENPFANCPRCGERLVLLPLPSLAVHKLAAGTWLREGVAFFFLFLFNKGQRRCSG